MNSHNQKIKCSVKSCMYYNCDSKICNLKQIEVKACPGCTSGIASDESMCGNYKCKCN